MNGNPPVIPADGRHLYALRVYYEDTDAGGVVYHAGYLRFAERARTEALRAMGIRHAEMTERFGLMFVVRRVEVDYLRAGGLDDSLVVETTALEVGGASVLLRQDVKRQDVDGADGLCASLKVRLACVRVAPGLAGGRPEGSAENRVPPASTPGPSTGSPADSIADAPVGARVDAGLGAPVDAPVGAMSGRTDRGGNKPGRIPPRWRIALAAMRDAGRADWVAEGNG